MLGAALEHLEGDTDDVVARREKGPTLLSRCSHLRKMSDIQSRDPGRRVQMYSSEHN